MWPIGYTLVKLIWSCLLCFGRRRPVWWGACKLYGISCSMITSPGLTPARRAAQDVISQWLWLLVATINIWQQVRVTQWPGIERERMKFLDCGVACCKMNKLGKDDMINKISFSPWIKKKMQIYFCFYHVVCFRVNYPWSVWKHSPRPWFSPIGPQGPT